jgi:hypothetical protein
MELTNETAQIQSDFHPLPRALCLGVVGYIARTVLLDDARQHVIQNARIIMETMLSSRTYTTKQVAPLLQQKNFKLQTEIREFRKTIDQMPKTLDPNAAKDIRGNEKKGFILGQQHALEARQQFLESVKGKPEELVDNEFHPQSVPAFGANTALATGDQVLGVRLSNTRYG